MYRMAIEELKKWKANANRRPLIIRGARQVGKTWLMKEFGATCYSQCVYINFDGNERMRTLFDGGFDISRIITGIELYAGFKINGDTLLIFDEVQEVPKALTSLKYFREDASQYHILCAGSMLGVALHPGTSFPVGKVDFLDLHPLSFFEFMRAMGHARLVDLLTEGDYQMASAFAPDYTELLKYYYFTGGMPEVVQSFAADRDFNEAREIQRRILNAYEQDFSKHAPAETVPRIRQLWNSIPAQLTKENKKFIYGLIKTGARAREYELALLWLTDCGLVHKAHRVTAPKLPLKAYEDVKAFKLFLSDIGLLSCMTGLKPDILLDKNNVFTEFKGAITEQFVLQQLRLFKDYGIYYWTSDSGSAEVDFVIDTGRAVVPVEVKAETNLQAKSLKVYRERFEPPLAVRASMSGYKTDGALLNLPLYMLEAAGLLLQ
jgi:predicted AAA+ superfamily ATPase